MVQIQFLVQLLLLVAVAVVVDQKMVLMVVQVVEGIDLLVVQGEQVIHLQ